MAAGSRRQGATSNTLLWSGTASSPHMALISGRRAAAWEPFQRWGDAWTITLVMREGGSPLWRGRGRRGPAPVIRWRTFLSGEDTALPGMEWIIYSWGRSGVSWSELRHDWDGARWKGGKEKNNAASEIIKGADRSDTTPTHSYCVLQKDFCLLFVSDLERPDLVIKTISVQLRLTFGRQTDKSSSNQPSLMTGCVATRLGSFVLLVLL